MADIRLNYEMYFYDKGVVPKVSNTTRSSWNLWLTFSRFSDLRKENPAFLLRGFFACSETFRSSVSEKSEGEGRG